jgi:DNA-binding NarL/FixJ family response regulator
MSKTSVIVADDHPLILSGIRRALEPCPQIEIVGETEDGREALDMTVAMEPDILILDLSLPRMSGMEVLKELRKLNLKTKVIVVSVRSDRVTIGEVLADGACGYIEKGADILEIGKGIVAVMAGNVHLSAGLAKRIVAGRMPSPGLCASLTEQEREIVKLAAEGMAGKTIGDSLDLAQKTAEKYRHQVMDKLGIDNLADLTKFAIRNGIIDFEI